MTELQEKIINVIKNRKITEQSLKDIKNKKNTPKDFNVLNSFLQTNQDDSNKNLENYNISNNSFENYCNNNSLLEFNNIKKYNSLNRLLNGTSLNKWKPLHRRLLMASKLNIESNPELSYKLKNDANWLKSNSKDLILIHNSNVRDKSSPSLKNLENYKVCMNPTYNLRKNILEKNHNLLESQFDK